MGGYASVDAKAIRHWSYCAGFDHITQPPETLQDDGSLDDAAPRGLASMPVERKVLNTEPHGTSPVTATAFQGEYCVANFVSF